MKSLPWSLIILLACLLSACSKAGQVAAQPAPVVTSTLDQSEAQRIIQAATVSCEASDKSCNPSVGMLLSAADDGVTTCTASLISPDILMTNTHCLPGAIQRSKASCADITWIKFPAVGQLPAITAECDYVIKATEIEEGRNNLPDYAFLRLKNPVSRESLKLSYAGIADQKSFDLYKVNAIENGTSIVGVLMKSSCTSEANSVAVPEYRGRLSPIASFTDCNLADGNFGAPIIDSDGRARGVIQSSNSAPLLASFLDPYLMDGQVNGLDIGMNLACMDSEEALPGNTPGAQCKISFPSPSFPSLAGLQTELQPKLNAENKTFSSQVEKADGSSVGNWGITPVPSTSSLLTSYQTQWGQYGVVAEIAAPTCFSAVEKTSKNAVDEPVELPIHVYRIGFNVDEIPAYKNVSIPDVEATLHYDPKEIFKSNQGTYKITIKTPNGHDEVLLTNSIPVCSD